MRDSREIIKRYIIFLLGLFFVSLGIALTTKAGLGTSPIAAVPYTLSLILTKLTLGNWTILFNYLLIVSQIFILKRKVVKIELVLQAVLTLVFGYCIDFCVWILTRVEPAAYWQQALVLLIGCVVLAFGVHLEVVADVVMLPGDAFVRAISKVSHVSFGNIRVLTDAGWTVAAGVLCMIFLGALIGVREGTIAAALLVGNIVKVYAKFFAGMERRLFDEKGDRTQ